MHWVSSSDALPCCHLLSRGGTLRRNPRGSSVPLPAMWLSPATARCPPPPNASAADRHGLPPCRELPPVRRRVVRWSQRASTHQHKKIFVSGTIGAFRLCSDKCGLNGTYMDLQIT